MSNTTSSSHLRGSNETNISGGFSNKEIDSPQLTKGCNNLDTILNPRQNLKNAMPVFIRKKILNDIDKFEERRELEK